MKTTLLILTLTSFSIFGATAQAGDITAGKVAYATCIGCHGENGEGGIGPKLAGQTTHEIIQKLTNYQAGKSMGPMTAMMAPIATGLSKRDMADIAAYTSTF